MASSKLAATTKSDLPRDSSICSLSSLIADQSITMDDLLKNIYSQSPPPLQIDGGGASYAAAAASPGRTVEEVWKEIVAGGGGGGDEAAADIEVDQVPGGGSLEEMTLEDFLTRAGAVREEDVGVAAAGAVVPIGYGQFQPPPPPPPQRQAQGGQLVYLNNTNGTTSGSGRGTKRRAVPEAPLDAATQQKQRRMIKNRESAARSRERKQAYTVELETLVTQLEEENARLIREEAERKNERFKKLMENLIPVVEKRRSPRVLRRVQSMHW